MATGATELSQRHLKNPFPGINNKSDREKVESHFNNQSTNNPAQMQRSELYSHRQYDQMQRAADVPVFNSSRRHVGPTSTHHDRLDNMRKSYDYGGGPSSGPGKGTNTRKNSHIDSSAVEILKNNPKKTSNSPGSTWVLPTGSTGVIPR